MTEKRFTDEVFRKMYDLGYRKALIGKGYVFFCTGENPFYGLTAPRMPVELFCFDNKRESLDIGEYLGVVDWSKVPVDTPIKVRYSNGVVVNRYFSKFAYGEVYYFSDGRTSWSELGEDRTAPKNVRLAGGDDERG